ncbi:sigma 54-interacting transcriptional regulator [Sorangium sp. So ce1024]|uniref:sigma 54-interacting transcriptional regulator n=1 Tax=Sorangium sp. So ce1024 TaxID=3133327 RepID=UPI003F0887DD
MADEPHGLTTSLMARAPRVALDALDLHVIAGPDRGAHRRLGPGKVRVGTAPGCDVRLRDPTVSRVHCELEVHGEGVRITDLESTNGTLVDGVRVHDAELTAGGTVSVGETVLRLELAGEPAYVELSRADRFGRFLGASPEIRRIYAILERVAPTDATILIQGETGTGKEALAHAIHQASERERGPFIAVDCGAIAESLIESELFGHVRGAFSGAVQDRIGLFEQASGGTLFLDEIGELPLSLQPKLLRALEMREVRRVGSSVSKRVDVRVLAATNRHLARGVNEGTFREDLYYRLAVLEIVIPPLRARRDDILLLAEHFYRSFSGRSDPLPEELRGPLRARAWPGNVRELRNFIERSVALGWCARREAQPEAPPPSTPAGLEALVPADLPLKEARELWTNRFESLYVGALLRRTHGNVTQAAALAGVTRRSLQRLIAQHGLRSGDAGDAGDDEEERGA